MLVQQRDVVTGVQNLPLPISMKEMSRSITPTHFLCLLPLFPMSGLHSDAQFTPGVREEEVYLHQAPGDEIQSLTQ